ncbi:MAG: glycosyltransferase family 4 protein [Chitinophagaceae bacterium]
MQEEVRTNLLMTADWFPPAYKGGGPVQSMANLAQQLPELGFTIWVVCRNTDQDGTPLPVKTNEWLPYNKHVWVWYNQGNPLKAFRTVPKLQVLYINGIYSPFFTLLPYVYFRGILKVVAPRGMFDAGALSQKAVKKKWYIAFLQLIGFTKQCRFHAASKTELEGIVKRLPEVKNVLLAPNFPRVFPKQARPQKQKGSLTLVTVALISAMKNYLMVLEALKSLNSEIIYHIYGSVMDKTYWQQCLAVIEAMPANIHVIYHGDIAPNKVAEALSAAHVYVQPSKSENFGHSLYEAFISGLPVITSNTTPWNQLVAAKAGINVSTNELEPLINALQFFVDMDNETLAEYSEGAHIYAQKAINLAALQANYAQLFT